MSTPYKSSQFTHSDFDWGAFNDRPYDEAHRDVQGAEVVGGEVQTMKIGDTVEVTEKFRRMYHELDSNFLRELVKGGTAIVNDLCYMDQKVYMVTIEGVEGTGRYCLLAEYLQAVPKTPFPSKERPNVRYLRIQG